LGKLVKNGTKSPNNSQNVENLAKNGQKEPTPFSENREKTDKKNRPFFPIFEKRVEKG